MAQLLALDHWLLYQISTKLTHTSLDVFFLWFTDLHKHGWLSTLLGLLLLGLVIYRHGKKALLILPLLVLTIAATDMICYRVIKKNVARARPATTVEVQDKIRTIGVAHSHSFPSNHAANSFAVATLLAWLFPRRRYYFYTLAGIVGFSRIYLGVHYPSDVIAGALLGWLVALACIHLVFCRFIPRNLFAKGRVQN